MIRNSLFFIFLFVIILSCSREKKVCIILPDKAGSTELLAAKEIRKYIYLRSGRLPEISFHENTESKNVLIHLALDTKLAAEEFSLKTYRSSGKNDLSVTGGSPGALLYAAYELAEQMGIRFYLHGDVIPDREEERFSIPDLHIRKSPLFETRGILPFHDFPEGPDWWNLAEYEAIIAQLPKLKMNFIGLHNYPWRNDFNGEGPKPEPLVWIGKKEDINEDGTIRSAYPVLHFHTADSTWGYRPANTSEFLCGASQLFEADNFGPDYMKGSSPWPRTEAENIRIFNESGNMFSDAFRFARMLGVKTCIGTETPLIVPPAVRERAGIKAETDEFVRELYTGMFSRIQKAFPVDYYWLWTPESWTWEGAGSQAVMKTERDIKLAYEVLREMGMPFSLATCGWVLGPQRDRTEFDRIFPTDISFSCINRGVGYTPVDKGFSTILDRNTWSIPWMEDDPDLLTAQLWVGRIRKDAFDSRKYGCAGLMGIHWRTRIISPNIGALAKAAWDSSTFVSDGPASTDSRDLPTRDFYQDWVYSEFGIQDSGLVKIFVDIDSKGKEQKEGYKGDALLNASDWIRGPGALMVNRAPAELRERIDRYRFIPRMEALRSGIKGPGNLERYDYWLNAFRFNRSVLQVTLVQVELNELIAKLESIRDPERQHRFAANIVLPKRIELAEKWTEMSRLLLDMVCTTGELGTIANLEMHNIRMNGNLSGHDPYLVSILQSELPEAASVPLKYKGKTRIIVTANPSFLREGEEFHLRIRVLSESDELKGSLMVRKLGDRRYRQIPLAKLTSHVFETTLSTKDGTDDFEYYIDIYDGKTHTVYPSTAGRINQTVVILGNTISP